MEYPWKKYGWHNVLIVVFITAMHGYFLSAALMHRTYLVDDSIQYLTIAENIAESGTFSQSFLSPLAADLQRTPGYPVFLLLLGRIPALVVIVQHILVLATGWMIYRAAALLYGNRLAMIGSKLYLLQPYPVILASFILSESLFIFLFVSSLYFFLRFWQSASSRHLAMTMVLLCAAAYVRPVALPLILLAIPIVLVQCVRMKGNTTKIAAVATLVPILLLGPWYLRNHAVSDRWTFSSMGEMGMLHGRLGGLIAWQQGQAIDEHNFYMNGDSVAASQLGLEHLRTYPETKQTHETEELSAGMGRLTLSYFLAHPIDAIRFEFHCLWEMLKGVGYGWAQELTHSRAGAYGAAALQLTLNCLVYLGFFLACLRRRQWGREERTMFFVVMIVLLISAAGWADGRYRVVIDPLLLMLTLFTLHRYERQLQG